MVFCLQYCDFALQWSDIILCDRLRRKKCEPCAGKVHFNAVLILFPEILNKTNIVMFEDIQQMLHFTKNLIMIKLLMID